MPTGTSHDSPVHLAPPPGSRHRAVNCSTWPDAGHDRDTLPRLLRWRQGRVERQAPAGSPTTFSPDLTGRHLEEFNAGHLRAARSPQTDDGSPMLPRTSTRARAWSEVPREPGREPSHDLRESGRGSGDGPKACDSTDSLPLSPGLRTPAGNQCPGAVVTTQPVPPPPRPGFSLPRRRNGSSPRVQDQPETLARSF